MRKYLSFKSAVGNLFVLAENDYLLAIDLIKDKKFDQAQYSPNDKFLSKIKKQLNEYLQGERVEFSIPFELKGTEFQQKVWQKLSTIPYHQIVSYKDLAYMIDRPNAIRAVGSAVGKNPLFIIIPCHRIISHNNKIGGFAFDLKIKKKLLSLEGHKIIGDCVL